MTAHKHLNSLYQIIYAVDTRKIAAIIVSPARSRQLEGCLEIQLTNGDAVVLGLASEARALEWQRKLLPKQEEVQTASPPTQPTSSTATMAVQAGSNAPTGRTASVVDVSLPNASATASTSPKPTTALSTATLGVSVACLQWLAGMVIKDSSLNAHEYCLRIKTLTEKEECAFIDIGNALQQQQPTPGEAPWIAPATSFVSHTWTYPFATVMEVMLKIALDDPRQETYFWFDTFCNNQHFHGRTLDSEVLSELFGSSVLAIGRVDLVLSP